MSNLDIIIATVSEWGACDASLAWLSEQEPDATLAELWGSCPDGGWLSWLVAANHDDTGCPAAAERALSVWYVLTELEHNALASDEDLACYFRETYMCPDLSRFGIK